MNQFSERLREVIEMRGVSQKHVADVAKTTTATISRYITGKNYPPILEYIRDIAIALDVSTDFILGVTNIPQSKENLTQEEQAVCAVWNKITEDDKKVIFALLDKYLSPKDKERLGRN